MRGFRIVHSVGERSATMASKAKKNTKEPEGIRIPNVQLESVVTALMDIGRNRLVGVFALEVFRVKKCAAEALGTLMELKDDVIRAHAPEGAERIERDDPNWEDFEETYNALYAEASYLEVEPLSLTKLSESHEWECVPDSIGILDAVGVLVE